MRFPRLASVVLTVTTSLALGGLPEASRAQTARSLPTFGQPTISGVQGNGFEQDIRVGPSTTGPGTRIYTSVPGALSSDHSWVWRSLDYGRTFKWVPAASPLTGKFGVCPGGGDTELALDTKGRLYFNDLTLVNLTSARSDDEGRTIAGTSCASVETTPDDRQWYAVDGDPLAGGNIYLTYNIVGGDTAGCTINSGIAAARNQLVMARSPLPGVPATAGIQFAPSKLITAPCDEGIMGNMEVSPTTHRIFVIHPDAFRTEIRIARCDAVPFTQDPTGLSCVDRLVDEHPISAPPGCIGADCRGFKNGANFPSLAIDTAGNLYAIWQMAPVVNCGPNCRLQGDVVGDTLLYWSVSRDEGETWSEPIQIPTVLADGRPLHNNVFTWAGAGDPGRVDIAWYGTPAPTQGNRGPDSSPGDWSVYFTQTLNGLDPAPTFTPPIEASEHFVHRGTMFTLIGRQTGQRDLGDFLMLDIGPRGEAHIAYGDSKHRVGAITHGMYVRQIGGPGVFARRPVPPGSPPVGHADDPAGDARYEALGLIGANEANLDILSSSVTQPDSGHYRITMRIADLRSLAPNPEDGNPDPNLVWQTQWMVPSGTLADGGRKFFVYMESTAGGTPRCFLGQVAVQLIGGGGTLTYPGSKQLTGDACRFSPTAPGNIVITVPVSDVQVPAPVDNHLHSVTASTITMPTPANTVPDFNGIGGLYFNLIDVAPGYDVTIFPG